MNLTELRRNSLPELTELAADLGVGNINCHSRQELTLCILHSCAERNITIYGEGFLEVLPDGFGFLRSASCGYLPGPDDIYVSPSQIRLFSLRKGEHVSGEVRPPREGERYFALLKVGSVGHSPAEEAKRQPSFEKLTPIYPNRPMKLAGDPAGPDRRILDLTLPLGFGQRCLISAPPQSGKSTLLRHMAAGIAENHPKTHVILLLIDQRPEELTELERAFAGKDNVELVSSSFEEAPQRHVLICEMLLEKGKRLAERRQDVVVLLDSLTSLSRACNAVTPSGVRMLPGGLEPTAMQRAKRIFAAARNLEEGGSLTVIATAQSTDLADVDDSLLDRTILDEIRGMANMSICLDKQLAEDGLYPAIDFTRSGNHQPDKLLQGKELDELLKLRAKLQKLTPSEAMQMLRKKLGGSSSAMK